MKIGDKVWVNKEKKIGFIYDITNPHLMSPYHKNETQFTVSVNGKTLICTQDEIKEISKEIAD